MVFTITTNLGLTPKVARIHWDDLVQLFELHISWQLITPLGAFPQKEEVLTFGDLASLLNAIKTIWAIVASGTAPDESVIYAPLGDFTILGTTPEGMTLRPEGTYVFPDPGVGDILAPDDVPDYDGESDDWGATPPA